MARDPFISLPPELRFRAHRHFQMLQGRNPLTGRARACRQSGVLVIYLHPERLTRAWGVSMARKRAAMGNRRRYGLSGMQASMARAREKNPNMIKHRERVAKEQA